MAMTHTNLRSSGPVCLTAIEGCGTRWTSKEGRSVDFDTFLSGQARAGRICVLPIAEEDIVHPSQMICQFTALLNRRGYVPSQATANHCILPSRTAGGET